MRNMLILMVEEADMKLVLDLASWHCDQYGIAEEEAALDEVKKAVREAIESRGESDEHSST